MHEYFPQIPWDIVIYSITGHCAGKHFMHASSPARFSTQQLASMPEDNKPNCSLPQIRCYQCDLERPDWCCGNTMTSIGQARSGRHVATDPGTLCLTFHMLRSWRRQQVDQQCRVCGGIASWTNKLSITAQANVVSEWLLFERQIWNNSSSSSNYIISQRALILLRRNSPQQEFLNSCLSCRV
jgi:hypothetical protein